MSSMEIARRLSDLGESSAACEAYTHAVGEGGTAEEMMEAAVYLLKFGKDYRVAYTLFRNIYDGGFFQEDILEIMTEAFYEPNVKLLKSKYEKNCKLLGKYPYLFRRDFPHFEDLPVRFFPYDDNGFVPYDTDKRRFGEYINYKNPVISRNFFHNLEKPILADDVYSQYELEYLNDNVRDSARIGRENHIYLHYTNWELFCSHLQVLNLRPLLKEKKFVFLIEDDIEQYPLDFKKRFHIDYGQYTPQPVSIREVQRLIWHTQLSAHNGGDFFNEVFDNHPNLLILPSVMYDVFEDYIAEMRRALKAMKSESQFVQSKLGSPRILSELYRLENRTDKDIIIALFLSSEIAVSGMDQYSRIAPAVFFQPHFHNIECRMDTVEDGRTILSSNAEEALSRLRMIRDFKYKKVFTPMRRLTNSYAATVRFMYLVANLAKEAPEEEKVTVGDVVTDRILNRTFMIDPGDSLYRDSVLVRFEDGKLNPRATFAALAAFLDLPYTQSMTACTQGGQPVDIPGNAVGFDPDRVYRRYEEYANDSERYFIEYFMRDVYQAYGYDFQYYDGELVDETKAAELIDNFTTLDRYIRETWRKVPDAAEIVAEGETLTPELEEKFRMYMVDDYMKMIHDNRIKIAKTLLRGLEFVNRNGQPLRMMPLLQLDPALLEQPLYH